MPIQMLVSKIPETLGDGNPTYRRLDDYELRQLGNPDKPADPDKWWIETTYVGRVITKREANGYHDSDFYAYVQTDTGEYKEVQYASTRGWTYLNGATVDATDDVIDGYEQWRKDTAEKLAADIAEEERRIPDKGKQVRIVAGKHKGGEGEVFWKGIDKYKSNRWATFYRVGVNVGGDKVFVPLDNVEVLLDGEFVEPVEESVTRKIAPYFATQPAR